MESECTRKLAVFDYHGTLIWALDIHDRAFRNTVKELYGVDGSIHDVQFAASTVQSVVKGIARAGGISEEAISQKEKLILGVYEKNFANALKQGHPIILPGVQGLLRLLTEKNFILGLYSGESKNTLETILSKSGLNKYFDKKLIAYASRDAPVSNRKELLLEAIEKAKRKYGEIPYGSVFLFDDSATGICAGKELGVVTVAVSTGLDKFEKLASLKPDYLYRDFSTPEKVVGRLTKHSNHY